MLQLRSESCFVDEHPDEIGVARELRKNAFERDALLEAMKPLATCDEHLGHSPRRQATFDVIRPQKRPFFAHASLPLVTD